MKWIGLAIVAIMLFASLSFADAGADSIAASMVDTSNGNYYALVMSTLGVSMPAGSAALITSAKTTARAANNSSNYTLQIVAMPSNGGWTSGSGSYYYGQIVEISAAPYAGYSFSSFHSTTGNCPVTYRREAGRATVKMTPSYGSLCVVEALFSGNSSNNTTKSGLTTKTTGSTSTAATTATTARNNKDVCYCGTMKVSCTQSAKELCGKNLVSCQARYAWSGNVPQAAATYPGAPVNEEEQDIIGIVAPKKTTGAANNSTAADYPGEEKVLEGEDRAFGIAVD